MKGTLFMSQGEQEKQAQYNKQASMKHDKYHKSHWQKILFFCFTFVTSFLKRKREGRLKIKSASQQVSHSSKEARAKQVVRK